ncbi:MAG: hypothetical protein AAFQ50_09020, partial [Pseudomonadota bacterium]
MISKPNMRAVVAETWGHDAPDWVKALADACDESSQSKVSRQIGLSSSVISQTLRGTYPGSMRNVEEQVSGALLSVTVACPILGDLATHVCRDWRKKSDRFAATNSLRVRMFRACNQCPEAV